MTEVQQILDKYLDRNLRQIVISGARKKDGVSRVRIRPVLIKEKLMFQCTKTLVPKEFHENHDKSETIVLAEEWLM